MFYSLTGKLIHNEPAFAVISCAGVGYKCSISMNTQKHLPSIGKETTLLTHLQVREDSFDLFGFIEQSELDMFRLLINISGVGAKVALAILSELTPPNICIAAAAGDNKAFSRANGVGPKLASRIVLELKDKVSSLLISDTSVKGKDVGVVSAAANSSGAVAALMALGYSASEASFAVAKIDSSLKTEDIIREALKALSKT